ncbi:MAG: efflux RND transporter periplasmic adaptor subunit [Kofleriaceae bacterium]|nr:efflux RND transporter periplasmic adaptor subunit [Kofleriaceae bacterium]
MKRLRPFLIVSVLVLGLMSVNLVRLLSAQPVTEPRAGDRAIAARVAPAPPGQVDEREVLPPAATVTGNGVIEPHAPESRLGAAVSGRVATVAVVDGQKVAAGDVLIELDVAVERAALAAAEAEAGAARAQLARVARGSRREDISAALADADTARARAELSRGVADRLAKVGASGAATVDEVERARRQAEADAAAARASAARGQAVVAGSRREDVQLARAQLAAAEARRDQAAAAIERATVRAPFAGEVLQVKVRVGEFFQPGTEPLVVLADTSQLRVRMDVDERDVGKVALGAEVVVRANAYAGQDFGGTVVELGRRMGRKNVRSDDPTERNDTKIREVVIALAAPGPLLVGQRVTCFVR